MNSERNADRLKEASRLSVRNGGCGLAIGEDRYMCKRLDEVEKSVFISSTSTRL